MPKPPPSSLRALPSVNAVLTSPAGAVLCAEFGHNLVKMELRALLDEARAGLTAGRGKAKADVSLSTLAGELSSRCRRWRPEGRRAINATGILLHTGLGRAPLADDAIAALAAAGGATPLQASIDSGSRSLREERVERLLVELIGGEAATVVNNNAAATMLVLATAAAGREVIISRGQLIEIGGAFRMPDVMAMSGCVLREVGTTNRTHLKDYAAAIGERTGAIIHVHTSNYRVRGFTGAPELSALVELARAHRLPVIDDLGSGALVPLETWGLPREPLVKDSLAAGADLCCFSGDKLIGGPQAGIIVGRREWIARLRQSPFSRMFRVCKLTLAALETTLLHFLNGTWRTAIPFYRMLDRPVADLRAEAKRLAAALSGVPGLTATAADDLAYVGSGSAPDEGLPSATVRLAHRAVSADDLAERLRRHVPAVFTRLADRQVVIDLRTLREGEAELVATAVRRVLELDHG